MDSTKTRSRFLSLGIVCKIKSMEGALLGLHCSKHRAPFEGGRFPPAIKATPLRVMGGHSPRRVATPLERPEWAGDACASLSPSRLTTAIRNGRPAFWKAGPRGCYGRTRFLSGFDRSNRTLCPLPRELGCGDWSDCFPPCRGDAFECLRLITKSLNAVRVLAWAVRAICSRVGIPTRDCGEFSRP